MAMHSGESNGHNSLEVGRKPAGQDGQRSSHAAVGTEISPASTYSIRKASMGSMLEARRAGMNPANAAATDRTITAIRMLHGS